MRSGEQSVRCFRIEEKYHTFLPNVLLLHKHSRIHVLVADERDELKALVVRYQDELTAAVAAAEEAQRSSRNAAHERERIEIKYKRAQNDITRLEKALIEEKVERGALTEAITSLAQQASSRRERLSQLLSLGELLNTSGGEDA